MQEISEMELATIHGGGWTWCGIGVGLVLGSTLMYGGLGFAFTINKAATACALAPFY